MAVRRAAYLIGLILILLLASPRWAFAQVMSLPVPILGTGGVVPAAEPQAAPPPPVVILLGDENTPLRLQREGSTPGAAVTTFDIIAVSAYMRSASSGGGTLLNPPQVGQQAYFHINFQVTGSGGPATFKARAVLDGQTMCSFTLGSVPVNNSGTYLTSCTSSWKATAGNHTLQWDLDFDNLNDEPNEANNSASTNFTPTGANLEAIGASLRTAANGGGSLVDPGTAGTPVFFTVDWQFNGSAASQPVDLRAMLDGVQFCSITVNAAAPSTNTSSCPGSWNPVPGYHTLLWDLDYTSTISEGSETDNSKSKFFHPGGCTGGLAMSPTFDPAVTAAEQGVIQSALNFYSCNLSDPITVSIKFQRMGSGLGQSQFSLCQLAYTTFNSVMRADINPASPDDALAFAGGRLPAASPNPVPGANADGMIYFKPATARALNIGGCTSGLAGGVDGIISFNNSIVDVNGGQYSMLAVIQHEINEILGLGSARATFDRPYPQDLFRYASTANTRIFDTSASCPAPTQAFFSIDGTTHINEFNNCTPGGDYGDWITHTPSQVQDAVTNGTGSPYMTTSVDELRALDVIGYNLTYQSVKRRRGQVTGD